jgi:hypothetical protein
MEAPFDVRNIYNPFIINELQKLFLFHGCNGSAFDLSQRQVTLVER